MKSKVFFFGEHETFYRFCHAILIVGICDIVCRCQTALNGIGDRYAHAGIPPHFRIVGRLSARPPLRAARRRAPAAGDIRFEHVSFAYQDKKALHDVSIVFPMNTLTALFGASGVETVLYE